MGFLDDMSAMLDQGLNAMDKRSQVVKLESRLQAIRAQKSEALALLGQDVLTKAQMDDALRADLKEHIERINKLDSQAETVARQIEVLKNENQQLISAGRSGSLCARSCPQCGALVQPGASFCPNCGDSMAAVSSRQNKSSQMRCKQCGTPLEFDTRFCGTCGMKVES